MDILSKYATQWLQLLVDFYYIYIFRLIQCRLQYQEIHFGQLSLKHRVIQAFLISISLLSIIDKIYVIVIQITGVQIL